MHTNEEITRNERRKWKPEEILYTADMGRPKNNSKNII